METRFMDTDGVVRQIPGNIGAIRIANQDIRGKHNQGDF